MEQIFSKLEFITHGQGFTDITNDLNLFIEKNNLGLNYLNELKESYSKNLQKEFFAIDLISLLTDHLVHYNPELSNKINNFVNPNELFLTMLSNP